MAAVRLATAQRAVARRQSGSRNYEKAKRRVDGASRISRLRFVCTNGGSIFDADVKLVSSASARQQSDWRLSWKNRLRSTSSQGS